MKRMGFIALAGVAIVSIALADGTGSNKGVRTKGASAAISNKAETGLVGIKLYQTGLDVVRMYGSPDEIQDVAQGGGGAVGPAGQGGARGQAGNRGRGGAAGDGGASGSTAEALWNIPGIDWVPANFQGAPSAPSAAGAQGGPGGPGGAPSAAGAQGGPAGAPGGGGAAAGAADARILFTRWIYRRGNSRYAFILNRYNQVTQIEAIGSADPKVSTNRGVRYGTQFADIIKKYGAPDGYEISGNTLVLRYLVNNKVAFRMNRLKTDGKHVVTGIVVAAGKM